MNLIEAIDEALSQGWIWATYINWTQGRQTTRFVASLVNLRLVAHNSPIIGLDWRFLSCGMLEAILPPKSKAKYRQSPCLFLYRDDDEFCMEFRRENFPYMSGLLNRKQTILEEQKKQEKEQKNKRSRHGRAIWESL